MYLSLLGSHQVQELSLGSHASKQEAHVTNQKAQSGAQSTFVLHSTLSPFDSLKISCPITRSAFNIPLKTPRRTTPSASSQKMSETVPPAPSAAASAAAPSTAPAAPQDAGPKLTPAQLKAQKKAEKAARRGQVVAAKNVAEAAESPASNESNKGTPKPKTQKHDTATTSSPATNARGPKKAGPAPVQAPQPPPKPKGPEVPEAFSYLTMAKKLPLSKADKDVHPAVLAIGQQMANFTLKDNLARLEAMLVAFQKVSVTFHFRLSTVSLAN